MLTLYEKLCLSYDLFMSGTLESHYGSEGIVDRIVDALDEAGTDVSSLTPDSFAGADEFHIGGRKGSEIVADLLNIEEGRRIIDLGCGIGGPARFLARTKGIHVTGIDLTPEFVEAASALTQLVGMSDKVDFHEGSATNIPFGDDSFDAATMIHVGMNIADKALIITISILLISLFPPMLYVSPIFPLLSTVEIALQ